MPITWVMNLMLNSIVTRMIQYIFVSVLNQIPPNFFIKKIWPMFLLFFQIIFYLTKSIWSQLSNFHIFNFKPKLYIRNPVRRFYNWTYYDRFNVTMNLFPMAYTLLFLVFKKSTTIILFFAQKKQANISFYLFF